MFCSLSRLRAAVKSGPPFVLFTLFILALALSTLFLGLFIERSSDPLKNPDIISWDSLLNSLSRLDYCIIPSNASTTHAFPPQKGISLSFPMSIVSLEGSEGTKPLIGGGLISGTIPLKALKSLRSSVQSSYQNSQIPIHFHISSKEELNCISIYGPFHILRDLQRLSLTSKETKCQNSSSLNVYTFSINKLTCTHTRMKLSYKNKPELALFLSQEDRQTVYSHLVATSAFLFLVFGVITLMACVRGVGSRDNYKFNSRRGDMELLRSDSPFE